MQTLHRASQSGLMPARMAPRCCAVQGQKSVVPAMARTMRPARHASRPEAAVAPATAATTASTTSHVPAAPAPSTQPNPFHDTPMGTVLTLERAESEIVMAAAPGPLIPTPSVPAAGSLDLHPLDMMFRRFEYTGWGLVFPGQLDVAAAKAALAQLLPLYPVLAGQADRRRGRAAVGVRWDLAVRGVEFLTAHSALSADQLMPQPGRYSAPGRVAVQACPDMAVLDEGLPASHEQLLDEGGPLTRVTIVHLAPPAANPSAPGGTLLAVHAHHILFDGGSLRRVLEDWAALTRSIVSGDAAGISDREAPVFGRGPWDDLVAYSRAQGHCSEPNPQHFLFDTFYPPEQLPANPNSAAASSGVGPFSVVPIRPTTHDFTGPRGRAEHGGPFTPAVFVHFSAQHIAALKEKALADIAAATHQSASNGVSTGQASTKPAFLSSNDVVSARMWQLLSKLPTYSKDARTRFLRVTDYRGRLGTPQHSTHHHQKGPSDHNGHTAAVSQPDHPTIPKSSIGNWVGFTPSKPMAVAQATLGTLAAELRANLGAAYSKLKAFQTFAYLQWADDQGEGGRCWLSKTTMWEARDAEVTSTSWDVKGPALDFGAGAPVWLQRTIPTFIQNHLIVITDMMPDEAQGPSTSTSNLSSSEGASDGEAGTKSKGRGLWVALGLTPPDMEAFVKEGVEEITL